MKQVKKKVLFRVGNLGGGGAEKVLITFLKNYDRERISAGLLLHQYSGVYLDEMPDDVPMYYLGKGKDQVFVNSWLKPIVTKWEKKKFKWYRNKPRIIYNKIVKDSYDIEVAFLHDIIPYTQHSPIHKKIGWVHTDLRNSKYIDADLRNQIIESSKHLDKVICVSNQALDSFVRMGGDERKVVRVYNPLDNVLINQKAEDMDVDFNDNTFNILSIGRLHPLKGFDTLIESIEILLKQGVNNIHLYIIGEGDYRKNLESLISSKNLNSYVSLLGFKKNPYPYIKACDLFVISSAYEGFSLVTAEAMILHKLILSTPVTGPKELLQNGKLGILTEKDAYKFAKNIKEIIRNPDIGKHYIDKLKQENFPFLKDNIIPEIEELLLRF